MSVQGQKHALPQCSSNGRFSSISGHNVGRILPALPTGLGRYVTATLASAKGLPAVPNMRPMVAG
jgi:hypothetical protein